MKNREYWQKRFEQLQIKQINKSAEYYAEIEKQFKKAMTSMQNDIEKWYMRFADNEGITLQEARKRLNARELEEFRWTVEEYIEKGKTLKYSDEFAQQLENASARVHINRLEALKLQLQQQIEELYGNMIDGLENHLQGTYEYGFYHTCFELEKGIGFGIEINRINPNKLKTIIAKPWTDDGSNFSERIWGKYRPQLVKTLHTELTQACIRGDNPKKVIDKIAKKFEATKRQAGNLVMTESAYFSSLATKDGYKEIGVEQYEVLATLDLHTSEICRDMDGKVFKLSEYEIGVTAPHFHCRCRSTTCPYFDDEFTIDEKRIARNEDGSQYLVSANMKYREWEKELVRGEVEKVPLEEPKPKSKEKEVEIVEIVETEKEIKAINKNGKEIAFDLDSFKNKERKEKVIEQIKKLANEYNTNLEEVTRGAVGVGTKGDTDYTGKVIRLNTTSLATATHEFAHTLSNSKWIKHKYNLDDSDFWKEIGKIKTRYAKEIRNPYLDGSRRKEIYISNYAMDSVDEFMAESFARVKIDGEIDYSKEGYNENLSPYALEVVEVIDKYFKK